MTLVPAGQKDAGRRNAAQRNAAQRKPALQKPALRKPDAVWTFTRRLRTAGRAASVLWGVALVGFFICVTVRASLELQSALGVVSSAFLAVGYALQAFANRTELRAVDFADAQRRELISSTTRRR